MALRTIKVLEVKPKLKSDGSPIKSAKGTVLKSIKAVGVQFPLETWDNIEPNQEIEVNIEKKEYNGYTNYLVSLPRKSGGSSGGFSGSYNKPKDDPNKHITMLIGYAKDLAIAGDLFSMETVKQYSRELMQLYKELAESKIENKVNTNPNIDTTEMPKEMSEEMQLALDSLPNEDLNENRTESPNLDDILF